MELAKNIALSEWRTATHVLQRDDMISLANLGLVDAANRWEAYCRRNEYDPSATQYFHVFARLRIRGTIRDQIRKDDWATRTLRSKAKKLKDAGQDEGKSVSELSELTGMSETDIRKVTTRLAAKPVSLDALAYNDNVENSSVDISEVEDTESRAFSRSMILSFLNTLQKLDKEIQLIIVLHYYSKLDLRKIAEELQLSEPKVSQLHRQGLLTIKEALTTVAKEMQYE